MSTEETKEPEEEEKVPIPPYFDRYVASELRALGQRITDLKALMDERFVALKESMDERFVALKESMEERFAQVDSRFAQVDSCFAQVDRRFEEVNERFDKLESTLKWAVGLLVGLFVPVIVGILAIIIKMFFLGKLTP